VAKGFVSGLWKARLADARQLCGARERQRRSCRTLCGSVGSRRNSNARWTSSRGHVPIQHPEPASRADATTAAIVSIAAQSRNIFGVHATLIAVMALTAIGVAILSPRLPRSGALSLTTSCLLSLSMLSMSLAALVNGFAVPLWAASYPLPLTEATDAAARAILYFASSLNRVFADCAVLLSGFALMLFGSHMARQSRPFQIVGAFGLIAGCGLLAGLVSGALILDYQGFNLANATLYIWLAAFSGCFLFSQSASTQS
jgi:hypothetical protein